MRALTLLQKHHVDYNVLVCVNRTSAQQPLQVYDFLRDAGVEFIQFIPLVERTADETAARDGLKLHALRRYSGRTDGMVGTPRCVR